MACKRLDEVLTIFTIPLELTHHILTFCRPRDVAVFSRTCRAAHKLAQDEYLWQRLWLAYPFDDPAVILSQRQAANLHSPPTMHTGVGTWRVELTRRMKAEFIARMKRKRLSRILDEDKKDALDILISALSVALPALDDSSSSANMRWLDTVLDNSKLVMSTTATFGRSPDLLQRQARLRSCMHPASQMSVRRNESRAFVYDLRNCNSGNDFGPLDASGNVNWVHVEHLTNVILANIRDSTLYPAPPLELESLRAYTAPGNYSSRDWAGVEGNWRRYVCFMDYHDLLSFNAPANQHSTEGGPLRPDIFEDPDFGEATRLVGVKLHILPETKIRFFKTSDLPPSASLRHPLLFFSGSSKGITGNEALIEGYVRVADDGTTRWKLISIYDDGPQWSFHGVQLGDIGSAKGIIGVWTTTTHERRDPAGPSWLWKVAKDCPEDFIDYI